MDFCSIEINLILIPEGKYEMIFFNSLKCIKCQKICLPPYQLDDKDKYYCYSCASLETTDFNQVVFSNFEKKVKFFILIAYHLGDSYPVNKMEK